MPTRRTPINRVRRPQINDVTLKQFDRLLTIELEGDHEDWEADGGRQREYHDLSGDILAALQVELHEMAPPAIWCAGPPKWIKRHPTLLDKWNAARARYLKQQATDHRRLLDKLGLSGER